MTFTTENDRIFCRQEGRVVAEVTFPQIRPGAVVIDHTWVDPSLRGQGAAGQLMQAGGGRPAGPPTAARRGATCSYAREWLSRHPEAADILDEGLAG